MPGPRLNLPFGPGKCSPLANCTQRDSLINLITNLDFEDDGFENSMKCAQSTETYVLTCRSFYDNAIRDESLPDPCSMSETNITSDSTERVIWMVLLLCVLVIVCLSLNTLRLVSKLRRDQFYEIRNNQESENRVDLFEMSPRR